jgi:phage protein U
MFAQLGNIIFHGLFGFESFESTDNPTYAQHDLINAKPVLQPTGFELEELTITIKMHGEFCNPSESIAALKKSKTSFEVLPLIKGNGQYLGDFVIAEMGHIETATFADGTILEATVTLLLREYAVADKLQQQQNAARKNGFANGDKKVVNIQQKQLPTMHQLSSQDLTFTAAHANVVNDQVNQYKNNVGAQASIADKIQKSLDKMDKKLNAFNDKVQTLTSLQNLSGILSAISNLKTSISNFTFPVTTVQDLLDNNTALQNGVKALNQTSSELITLVITRAA